MGYRRIQWLVVCTYNHTYYITSDYWDEPDNCRGRYQDLGFANIFDNSKSVVSGWWDMSH